MSDKLNGGYAMIDLSDYTLSGTSQTVSGLYAQITKAMDAGKPICLYGVHTATAAFGPFFPDVRRTTTNIFFSFAFYMDGDSPENDMAYIRVTNADAVTMAAIDVTNPTP